MAHLHLVAVNELTLEVAVDLVQVQTVVAAEQRLDELNVLTYLVDGAGTAGIVACGLNTTGEGLIALEADNIVGLPAMQ